MHSLDSCSIFLSTRGEQAETSTLCASLRTHLRKHTCDFQSSLSDIHCITKHYNALLTFLQFKALNFRWLETVTLLAEVFIVCMCSLFRTWNPKLSPVDPHRIQDFSEIYRPIISKAPISLQWWKFLCGYWQLDCGQHCREMHGFPVCSICAIWECLSGDLVTASVNQAFGFSANLITSHTHNGNSVTLLLINSRLA